MTGGAPTPPNRAQTFVVKRLYFWMKVGYLSIFALAFTGAVFFVVGLPNAAGLMFVALNPLIFFLGVSMGRLIETVGRRAKDEVSESVARAKEEEATEMYWTPPRREGFKEELGIYDQDDEEPERR